MKTKCSISQFSVHVDAVLSQNFAQHVINLSQSNIAAFYQTCDHPDVINSGIVNAIFTPA
ncbi:MAG: hypothetical protein JRI77_07145 [Deltaproteobacteria bacterium]|nr:hypothetical protein [Deltaproteobacteria bacterium]